MLYRTPLNANHVQYSIGKNVAGTVCYVSISAHLGCEQSRRDDLESILYVIVYFLRENFLDRALEIKRDTHLETLCAGLPSTSFKNCRGDIEYVSVRKRIKV
jgi:hypothetical protein